MATTDEHRLLRSTAREVYASDPSPDDFAALGWYGLLTDERAGGAGWFPEEAALIAMEGGNAGSTTTWFQNALVAAFASEAPGLSGWTPGLLSGEAIGAFGHSTDLSWGEDVVSGSVARVVSDRKPNMVVLTGPPGTHTVAVHLGQHGAGVHGDVVALETERQLYRLTLDQVGAVRVSPGTRVEMAAIVLLCSDSVGAVARALHLVTGYLVEREAFEVPIASFQTIQHRLVDLVTFQKASEALVLRAAQALASDDPRAERLTLAAHAYIEGRAVQAIDECIQLAGGIGFTWEFPLHHALRRVATNAAIFGPGRDSRRRLASSSGSAR